MFPQDTMTIEFLLKRKTKQRLEDTLVIDIHIKVIARLKKFDCPFVY